MIEAWVAGYVSVTVTTEGTLSKIIITVSPQDIDTILQMTGKTRKETAMTTGAGQGKNGITRSPREKMTEKEEMIGERDTGLPRGVQADHPHHPVKALIPPFGVGEARMRGMLNQVGDQLTKSKRYELRKEAEVYNTLRIDDQQLRHE